MPQVPSEPYISTVEAAKRHNLTHDHVGLLCRRGKVEGMLLGRQWYVNENSLIVYIEQSQQEREARKKILSKQWHTAWTTAFIGFSLFALVPHNAAADYVSLPPKLTAAPDPISISVAAIAKEVASLKENISASVIPALKPIPAQEEAVTLSLGTPLSTQIVEGAFLVGETLFNIFGSDQSQWMQVVYAKDAVSEPAEQVDVVNMLTAAVAAVQTSASVPVPDFSYHSRTIEPLLTWENVFMGVFAANESLEGFNTAMFANYFESGKQLAAIAAFDAAQVGFVWEQTFGAVGRQFVSDVHRLGRAQAGAYLSAAGALQATYNKVADAIDATPTFKTSISVASIGYVPQPAAVQKAPAKKIVANTPPTPSSSAALTKPITPTKAVAPKVVSPQPIAASNLVTQESLNRQFAAWQQALLVLVNTQAAPQSVETLYPLGLGNGGGGTTVINNYAAAQRIDKLDGVTITNSSINGVSDFSNLGGSGGASALTALSDTLVASPVYGNVLMYNGTKWVNTATSSLGITGGSSSGSVGNWFTPTTYGNATSTLVGFAAGLLSIGSTTINGNATTTGNLYVSGSISSASSLRTSGGVYVGGSGGFIQWGDTGIAGSITGALGIVSDGVFRFLDSSGGGSPRIILGSSGSGWVSLKRNGASLDIRLGDDSGYASTTAAFFTANSTAKASTFPFASSTAITVSGNAYFPGGIWNSSGNLGIGTTSPYARLSVAGEIVGANLTATSTSATSTIAGGLIVGSGALTYDFSSGVTSINNLAIGSFTFDTDAGIVSWADLPVSSTPTAGTVESYTASVGGSSVLTVYGEADGSGGISNIRVGIGTSSPAYVLDVASTTGAGSVARFTNATGNCTINPTTTALSCSSDERLKKNITSIISTSTLSQVLALEPVLYNWISEGTTSSMHAGFIAQRVQTIFPDLVAQDDNGFLGVNYQGFAPYLTSALKEIASIGSTFKDNLIAWLADSANGITKIFAKEVHTDKLCVGDTCITQEEFLSMVAASGAHASAPEPESEETPIVEEPEVTPPASESASSTPQE